MRSMFALLSAVAALVGVQASDENPKEVLASNYSGTYGLNDAAKLSGKYMGVATDIYVASGIESDPYLMAELKNGKDWGMITHGNALKWEIIEPQQGVFDFTRADKFMALAKSLNYKVRCHTLVWHSQAPSWLKDGQWTNATLLAVMKNHITTVMTHFGDDCYAWDVVNEAIDDGGGFRETFWTKAMGPSFLAQAFTIANDVKTKLGLKVKLYYNDYGIEYPGSTKTSYAQQLAKDLVSKGIKIDGVGLQCHDDVGGTPSQAAFVKILNAYTSLGLDVAITELDIRATMPPSLAVQVQQVKDYTSVIAACKAVTKCVGVTIWDFIDNYSWVPTTFGGQGWALPWYQPNGKGTPLVRKAPYDAIIEAWGYPGQTQAPTPTPAPTSAAELWNQCGGITWNGPTTCKEGTCVEINDWYSQCQK